MTDDGGAVWRTRPIGRPDPGVVRFFGTARLYVDFVDARHGWVEAIAATGSGVPAWGILLHTSDGGRTRQRLPSPAGGPVEFVSPTTGWLAPSAEPDTSGAGTIWVDVLGRLRDRSSSGTGRDRPYLLAILAKLTIIGTT